MSSCSCQHLLIACNSSLRLTAGAVGLGPAPPAVACTHRGSPAGARASLAPLPAPEAPQLSKGFPRQNPSSPVPLPPSAGNLWWGFCGGGTRPSQTPLPGGGRLMRCTEAVLRRKRMAKAMPEPPAGCGATLGCAHPGNKPPSLGLF